MPDANGPTPGSFPTTRWSRVAAAGAGDRIGSETALAELCSAYWYPLYAFIRRKGNNPEQALDLTQGFFARLLERGVVTEADPARGRFRTFLLADCGHFLAHERERAGAARRGGRSAMLSIDARDAEGRYGREPAHGQTPERLFERTGPWPCSKPSWPPSAATMSGPAAARCSRF